jgi:N-acetylglucosaminyldiphosphoundecaprenol N-acetyl-beta-D-mannosaminyltransferase
METALQAIDAWIAARSPHYICIRDVHGVMRCQTDEELRRIHNVAGLVTPDGMPLVWLSRILGFDGVQRVYGPDLLLEACEGFVHRGYRHYFYGGQPGVAQLLATRLHDRFPGLSVAGTFSPPFRELTPDEEENVVAAINGARADIVWVGLGTPKQEYWMSRHVGRVTAPVLVGVGAAFDFHAGTVRQAPVWIRSAGFEWLFRLAMEPRRLTKRYLLNNPRFVWEVCLQLLGVKRYSLPSAGGSQSTAESLPE